MYRNFTTVTDDRSYVRKNLLQELGRRGVASNKVLEVMDQVPRHIFVSEALRYSAYHDTSLPIGFGQTISKPSVIARMVQALDLMGTERVLEIGTGSGYQTAILARPAESVVSMERIQELSIRARSVLAGLGLTNVKAMHSGNFHETEGDFDAIVVAAGADIFPVDLLEKLRPGGTLVIPVGIEGEHRITRYRKDFRGNIMEEVIGEATFVPLIL